VIDAMTAANGIAPDGVLADKGYASKANRQFLKDRGMADLRPLHSQGLPVGLHPWQA